MRKAMLALSSAAAVLFFSSSCNDFIAKDISGDTTVVILPQANSTVSVNPVHVKWEALEGATKYHIQIVSPSFSNISVYAIDSVVLGTNFFVALDSASYEMKITAMNAGYTSLPTAIIPFTVGTAPTGGGSAVVLLDPAANGYETSSTVDFEWALLAGASSYGFELHSGTSFAAPLTIPVENGLGVLEKTVTNLPEGTYTWGVKAFFSNGDDTPYTKRTFYIDTTYPGATNLVQPGNNGNAFAGNVIFSWTVQNPGTNPSPLVSILEISTDSGFTSPTITDVDVTTSSVSTTISLPTPGIYYWRVETRDAAGNFSATTATRILTVSN